MDEKQRLSLGKTVENTRLRRGLAKEQAAREVGVSSITLKRIEDGLTVRPDILARVLSYFDLPLPGDDGDGLGVEPSKVDEVRQVIASADLPDDVRRDLLERLDRDVRPAPPTPPVKPRATGTEGR